MGRLFKGCAIGCGALTVILLAVGLFVYRWFTAPPPGAPQIGKTVALRPTIIPKKGKPVSAGTAVAVRTAPGKPAVLITALHLFGPSGGMQKNIAPGELDAQIREIWLAPVGGKRRIVARAKGAVRKTGPALSDAVPNVAGDLAAFKLHPKSAVNALPLATQSLKFGDWVWLVGDVVDHEPQTQRLFPGRAWIPSKEATVVQFKEEFKLQAFSGAPLINAKGEVVGILIGGGERDGFAIINPVDSIRGHLGSN